MPTPIPTIWPECDGVTGIISDQKLVEQYKKSKDIHILLSDKTQTVINTIPPNRMV